MNITKLGNNLFPLASQKAIEVKAGDVIGWVGNGSSGTLAFEKTINDPSFYFSSSSSSFAVGSDLTKGSATRHEIKHVLRAHVSQPSQAAVVVEYTQAGVYNVSVSVGNVAESELRSCKITVQVLCYMLMIDMIAVTTDFNWRVKTHNNLGKGLRHWIFSKGLTRGIRCWGSFSFIAHEVSRH